MSRLKVNFLKRLVEVRMSMLSYYSPTLHPCDMRFVMINCDIDRQLSLSVYTAKTVRNEITYKVLDECSSIRSVIRGILIPKISREFDVGIFFGNRE